MSPFGTLLAVPERGTCFGNRGALHDARGQIRRSWQGKRWLLCRLDFRSRRRALMAPGRYTELFFLDEATGLAAGHRPCFECRRAEFLDFRRAWADGLGLSELPTAPALDARLHSERVRADGSRETFTASPRDLPDGVFVTWEAADGRASLLWGGCLREWSPGGYAGRFPAASVGTVSVLTPRSTVAALRAGYPPVVHPSVGAGGTS